MADPIRFTSVARALIRDDDHLSRLLTTYRAPVTRTPPDNELTGPDHNRAVHQTLVGPDGTWLVLNTRADVVVYVSDPRGS